MPCVSLRGGGSHVTIRLVELVFETCMLEGPTVSAEKQSVGKKFSDPCNKTKSES